MGKGGQRWATAANLAGAEPHPRTTRPPRRLVSLAGQIAQHVHVRMYACTYIRSRSHVSTAPCVASCGCVWLCFGCAWSSQSDSVKQQSRVHQKADEFWKSEDETGTMTTAIASPPSMLATQSRVSSTRRLDGVSSRWQTPTLLANTLTKAFHTRCGSPH